MWALGEARVAGAEQVRARAAELGVRRGWALQSLLSSDRDLGQECDFFQCVECGVPMAAALRAGKPTT